MISHYPVILEVACGMFSGLLTGLATRQSHGKAYLLLCLLFIMAARALLFGSADMDVILDHLLQDASQIVTWLIDHQALTFGFTLGFVIAETRASGHHQPASKKK